MTTRRFSDGEYIFRVGDPADGVYRIAEGQVRFERDGHSLGIYVNGEIFGEAGFLTAEDRDRDAIAAGNVTAEFLSRNTFIERLTRSSHLLEPLLAPLFDFDEFAPLGQPEPLVDEDLSPDLDEPLGSATSGLSGTVRQIRLVPDGDFAQRLVGAPEVLVDELPYRVGRMPEGEGKATYGDIHLVLADRRPFNLSRRHFAIEDQNGSLAVRDFGSYHGTSLNGTRLGGENQPRTAPLTAGSNELIAGRVDSPIRFTIIIE